MREQPAYGDEKYLLVPTRSKKGAHRLERQVFTERGATHLYDEETKDWVTWPGEYVTVETLGHFDSPESAAAFMNERAAAGGS